MFVEVQEEIDEKLDKGHGIHLGDWDNERQIITHHSYLPVGESQQGLTNFRSRGTECLLVLQAPD
jgi:hypothetical protein